MLARSPSERNDVLAASLLVAVAAAATLLGAWYFEYVAGLAPCPLCLDERIAYYVTVPLAALVAVAAARHAPRPLLALGLAVIALAMLANTVLAAYHAGVEWKWWPGPQDCSGAMTSLGSASDLLKRLSSVHVVRCDEAAWRLLGVSLAGYDVLVSLAIAGVASWGAHAAWRSRRR
jgi:disulfide bond formation protein DsbB